MENDNNLKVVTVLDGDRLVLCPVTFSKLWEDIELSLVPVCFQVLLKEVAKLDFNSLRKVRKKGLKISDIHVLQSFEEAITCLICVATCVKENMTVLVTEDNELKHSCEFRALLEKQITILGNQAELLGKYLWFLKDLRHMFGFEIPSDVKLKVDWILAKLKDESLNVGKKLVIFATATCVLLSEAMDCAKDLSHHFKCLKNCLIFDQVASNFTICQNISEIVLRGFVKSSLLYSYGSEVISEAVAFEKPFIKRILPCVLFSYMKLRLLDFKAENLLKSTSANPLQKENIEDKEDDVNPGGNDGAIYEDDNANMGTRSNDSTPDEENEAKSEGGSQNTGSQNSQRRLKRNFEATDYPDAKRGCQPRSGRGTR